MRLNHKLKISSVVLEVEVFGTVGAVQANQHIIISALSRKDELFVADENFTIRTVLHYRVCLPQRSKFSDMLQ